MSFNEMKLCVHSIACAMFASIVPKRLDTCTEAVEHRALFSFSRSRDRGKSSDHVSEVRDLGCDTTAVLLSTFLALKWVIAQQRALRSGQCETSSGHFEMTVDTCLSCSKTLHVHGGHRQSQMSP